MNLTDFAVLFIKKRAITVKGVTVNVVDVKVTVQDGGYPTFNAYVKLTANSTVIEKNTDFHGVALFEDIEITQNSLIDILVDTAGAWTLKLQITEDWEEKFTVKLQITEDWEDEFTVTLQITEDWEEVFAVTLQITEDWEETFIATLQITEDWEY